MVRDSVTLPNFHLPLVYYQTSAQHYTEVIMENGEAMQDYYDNQSSMGIRKKLIKQLKTDGMSDFLISLVLNIGEYEVKKMRKEL